MKTPPNESPQTSTISSSPLDPGLYLVPTPIGNLEDITRRSLYILENTDLIAAEDTRTARRLLHAYHFQCPLISLYRDNEAKRTPEIIRRLQQGERIALISEAGTPGISDPGYLLVRDVIAAGIPIIPIPGATAFVPALIASGLPCDRFAFLGFLPQRKGKRQAVLRDYQTFPLTLVFYASPHNLLEVLDEIQTLYGDRRACIAREITKRFEEFLRGPLSTLRAELTARDALRGEFVLVLEGASANTAQPPPTNAPTPEQIALELLQQGGRPSKLARQLTQRFPSLSRQNAYQILEAQKQNLLPTPEKDK